MKLPVGMFTLLNNDGSTLTHNVRCYETYQQMIDDVDSKYTYAIVLSDNRVYHKSNTGWDLGFANIGEKDEDCTAFDVYANDTDIPAGSNEIGINVWNDENLTIKTKITANMTYKCNVRSQYLPEDQDVIVDFGDGTICEFKNGTNDPSIEEIGEGGCWYRIAHTYNEPGIYRIKIFGKKYYALSYAACGNGAASCTKYNLVCRVFDFDLPIASHLTNLSSFLVQATRLLKISIPDYKNHNFVVNIYNMMQSCINVRSVTGVGKNIPVIHAEACGGVFNNCNAMVETDFVIPSNIQNMGSLFKDCPDLSMDILDLFPKSGFSAKYITVGNAFKNAKSLTLNEEDVETLGAYLWNNKDVTFSGTSTCFTGCDENLLKYIPTSWGGTKE